MTINHFLEHWQTKITDAGEICGASREAQNIKRINGCILLILLLLAAPGMSSNQRGQRLGARRSEDARRHSASVRRLFSANKSSASPTKDVLGFVPFIGGRRVVLPSMHGRSFTAPITREALRAERTSAAERAVQGVLIVAFCSFLGQLPPRLPLRSSTTPTFTSFLTQTPIMLTKELLKLPDAPSLLAQRCKLWRELPEHHHLVSLLSVDCAWFVSRLYHTFIARTDAKTLRETARALSESALQFL